MTSLRSAVLVMAIAAAAAATPGPAAAQAREGQQPLERQEQGQPFREVSPLEDVKVAVIRLPLAAALGALLAMRPKRRGTPPRTPAVIQTQIVLSIVGAVIMLVVGASLARAFGIVGAANLIRYRSKIDDPKDAVVMLCTLAVGLASGVGLYALALVSTGFMGAALWVIESFEPHTRKRFDLTVKFGKDTDERRQTIESVLRRFKLEFELRTSSDEEVCYEVGVPLELPTDRISNAILRLDPDGHGSVEWAEKKAKAK